MDVATVVSTQATVAEPIVSPPIYVVPSTGISVIADVERSMMILFMSESGGLV